jgi:hypothetical protein
MTKTSSSSFTGMADFLPTDQGTTPLQLALESLNVNLEDELLRYRQSRSKDGDARPFGPQLKFRPQKRRRPLNLIQVQAQTAAPSASRQLSSEGMPVKTSQPPAGRGVAGVASMAGPPPPPHSVPLTFAEGMPAADTALARSSPIPAGRSLQRRGGAITPYLQAPDEYLESTEALLDSLPSAYDDPSTYDDVDYEPSLREQLATPLGIGALLLLLVSSAGFGYFITSPTTAQFLRNNGLVQALFGKDSAAEPESQVEVVEPPQDNSVEGLQGLGPDLSEDEFQDLDLGRLSTLDQDEARVPASRRSLPPLAEDPEGRSRAGASPDEDTPSSRRQSATDSTSSEATPAPAETVGRDGASRPSSQLPTPVVRPQAPANPQPAAPSPRGRTTPVVTPVPQAVQAPQPVRQTPPQSVPQAPAAATSTPPQPLGSSPAAQPGTPVQTTPPQPLSQAAAAPSGTSTPTAPAPITQSPPQPTPNYYVVTDYTGDQSLESARSAVGGAYVRNFPDGARIQMGSFSQESAARGLVQQLQGQGIPARVYAP